MKTAWISTEVFLVWLTLIVPEEETPIKLPEPPTIRLPEAPNVRPPTIKEDRKNPPFADPFAPENKVPADVKPWAGSRQLNALPPVLVSEKKHQLYLSFWPNSEEEWFNDLKYRRIIFYDDQAMPRAYQIFDGRGRDGIHNARVNFTGTRDPHGNANMEFPWHSPAGIVQQPGHKYHCSNFKGIRFMILPENGKITWWRSSQGNQNLGVGWAYPVGTYFGEILLLTDSKGNDHTFEVRLREKRHDGTWDVDVFRPFASMEEYVYALAAHQQKYVYARDDTDLAARFQHVASRHMQSDYKIKHRMSMHQEAAPGTEEGGDPNPDGEGDPIKVELRWHPKNLFSEHPRIKTFNRVGWTVELPKAEGRAGITLLDKTPFKSVRNTVFVRDGANKTFAPYTQHADQIVPKNYLGGLLRVSAKSCTECHKDADKLAVSFDSTRDWWGRVRGSDNILSAHIFDPSCISNTGFGQGIALRKELVRHKLLEGWKGR